MTAPDGKRPSRRYETFTIRWTEEREYQNTYSVDLEDVRDWLGVPEDAEVSVEQVKVYLNSGDIEAWHDTASRGEPEHLSTHIPGVAWVSRKGS